MIVIIRDAVMPDCCNTCVCSEGYGCGITGTIMTTKEMESRPDWCPLEEVEPCEDAISRQAAIDALLGITAMRNTIPLDSAIFNIKKLPSVQPDLGKYEYHYDHTDCIWYRPEARNRCPVTCAQYRDGWNDAMNYIFRDGKGYRPYRRGEQYEE